MKFMISCRQPLTILKEATEIRVDYNDLARLRDFVTEDWVCSADIVIYIPKNQLINWDDFSQYKDTLNIVIAVEDAAQIEAAHSQGYKAFWAYPASTYWELRGLLDLEVDQVLLDAPLYFDLIKVKNICGNVEIRLVVNKCMNNYMKRKDGICGTYVRPEDVSAYEPYVSHMEFDVDELLPERTLFKIYTQQKQWPGNLNLLLTYLGKDIDNRGLSLLPTDEKDEFYFAHRRISCGQRCQEDPGRCNFCKKAFQLMNTIDQKSAQILETIEKTDQQKENI